MPQNCLISTSKMPLITEPSRARADIHHGGPSDAAGTAHGAGDRERDQRHRLHLVDGRLWRRRRADVRAALRGHGDQPNSVDEHVGDGEQQKKIIQEIVRNPRTLAFGVGDFQEFHAYPIPWNRQPLELTILYNNLIHYIFQKILWNFLFHF